MVAVVALAALIAAPAAATAEVIGASLVVPGVQGAGPGGSIVVSTFQFLAPNGKEVKITKTADTASAQLFQLTSNGTHVTTVVMTVTWPAKPDTVTYTMSDVVFTSYSLPPSGIETVTFAWTSLTQTDSRAAAVVAGQLFDLCTGKPVAEVSLTLSASSLVVASAVTDAKGRFKLIGIGDGTYALAVSASGYAEVTKTVVIAGTKSRGSVIVGLTPLAAPDGCG